MSAALHNVTANLRNARGKGAARRLRSEGQIPAVAYGRGLAATTLALSPKDILTVLKSDRGQNTVLQVKVDGSKDLIVMIKDYTYHPVKRTLEHVDFVEVKLDQPVDVDVPLIANGKPAGLLQGGVVRQVFRTVPVRCLPDRIPLDVQIDIAPLKLGESLHAKDLPLPEGVEVRLPAEQTLVAVVAPDKDRSEEAAAAPGAAAPGAAAAPAGKAAPAAAPAKDAKKK